MRRGLDRKARLVWGDRIRLESGARPAGRGRDGRCRRGWRRRDRPGMRPVLRGRPRRRLRGPLRRPTAGLRAVRENGRRGRRSSRPRGPRPCPASDPSIRDSGPFVPGEDSLAPAPGPFAPDSGPSGPGAASARETPMEMSRVSSSRRTASGLEASISCAGRKRNVRPSARRMSSHSPSALMKAPLSSGCAAATSTAQSMKAMCSLSPEKPAFRTSVHRRRDGCRARSSPFALALPVPAQYIGRGEMLTRSLATQGPMTRRRARVHAHATAFRRRSRCLCRACAAGDVKTHRV